MCVPFSSTFVEHQGLPVGEEISVHAFNVNPIKVKGNLHFIPALGPATVVQLPGINNIVKPELKDLL